MFHIGLFFIRTKLFDVSHRVVLSTALDTCNITVWSKLNLLKL